MLANAIPQLCSALTPLLLLQYEVDWWSLGVILFEMINGYTLFDGDVCKLCTRMDIAKPPLTLLPLPSL